MRSRNNRTRRYRHPGMNRGEPAWVRVAMFTASAGAVYIMQVVTAFAGTAHLAARLGVPPWLAAFPAALVAGAATRFAWSN